MLKKDTVRHHIDSMPANQKRRVPQANELMVHVMRAELLVKCSEKPFYLLLELD